MTTHILILNTGFKVQLQLRKTCITLAVHPITPFDQCVMEQSTILEYLRDFVRLNYTIL